MARAARAARPQARRQEYAAAAGSAAAAAAYVEEERARLLAAERAQRVSAVDHVHAEARHMAAGGTHARREKGGGEAEGKGLAAGRGGG